MSNVYAFHPAKSPLFTFYEVIEGEGETRWGGDTPFDTLTWLRLAPAGSRVLVSAWDAEGEDAEDKVATTDASVAADMRCPHSLQNLALGLFNL